MERPGVGLRSRPMVDDDVIDGLWLRWGASLMLYVGVGLLGLFAYWAIRAEGGVRDVTRVAVAHGDSRADERIGVGLDLTRWDDGAGGQGVVGERSRVTFGASVAGHGGVLATKVVAEPVRVGGEAFALPTRGVGLGGLEDDGGASFFGLRIDPGVKRVVFVIDASGSMASAMGYVVRELSGALRRLDAETRFTVVFFAGGGRVLETPAPGLKPASDQNKRQAMAWIQKGSRRVVAGGRTNPLAALRRGFSYEPQVMVLLSDKITGGGEWEVGRSALLAEVEALNRGGTRIDTVQFMSADPVDGEVDGGTLWEISERTGGEHRFVDGRALGIGG